MPKTVTGDTPIEADVRRVVRMLMARDGVSQEHLGEILGIPQQRVSQRLAGQSRFTFPELVRMARHFHVALDDFTATGRFLTTSEVESAWRRETAGRHLYLAATA